MQQGTVLITGCTSPIARAIALEIGKQGYHLLLAGRQPEEVNRVAGDIYTRTGVQVDVVYFDAEEPFSPSSPLSSRIRQAAPIVGTVFVHGYMGNQEMAKTDPALARKHVDVNFTSTVELTSLLLQQSEHLEFLCFIGSVAGDRGRKSNYVYGAAKAAIGAYAAGLRHDLAGSKTAVTVVKPGYVDTRMTYGQKGIFLVASPETVARKVMRSIAKGQSSVYVPGFWRLIMLIIRSLPQAVFHRLNI